MHCFMLSNKTVLPTITECPILCLCSHKWPHCAPLGVLECARWALSERARDGLCIVLLVCYCVFALGACMRAPRTVARRVAVSPQHFWPEPANPHTYYVKMGLCGRKTR